MWLVLGMSALVFWLPLLAITFLAARGIVRARRVGRRGHEPGSLWPPSVCVLASGLGLVGGLYSLQSWAEAIGLGRYLPPERQVVLTLSLALPAPLAAMAALASLGWLAVVLLARRRRATPLRVAD